MAFRGRSGRVRRSVEWIGGVGAPVTDTSSTNSFFQLMTAAQLATYVSPTLVRVRGLLRFSGDGAFLAGTQAVPGITVGVVIVSDQAASASAIPVPIVDLDADWLLWDQFGFEGSPDIASGTMFATGVLDSKAMRKIEQPDNAVIILAVSTTFSGAGDFRYRFTARALIKGD